MKVSDFLMHFNYPISSTDKYSLSRDKGIFLNTNMTFKTKLFHLIKMILFD